MCNPLVLPHFRLTEGKLHRNPITALVLCIYGNSTLSSLIYVVSLLIVMLELCLTHTNALFHWKQLCELICWNNYLLKSLCSWPKFHMVLWFFELSFDGFLLQLIHHSCKICQCFVEMLWMCLYTLNWCNPRANLSCMQAKGSNLILITRNWLSSLCKNWY